MKTRKQHIISRLKLNLNIIYIEPFKKGNGVNFGNNIDGIKIYTIPAFKLGIPFLTKIFKYKILRLLFDNCQLALLKFIRFLNFNNPIKLEIISNPFFIHSVYKNSPVIWDYNDDPFQFAEQPTWIEYSLNNFLINNTNQIWASSKRLTENLKLKYDSKVKYIPNGVEMNKFQIPKNISSNEVIIGYIGILSSWFFDFKLVKQISEKFPNAKIKLIGPKDPLAVEKIKELECMPNIEFIGKVNYNSLPQLISTFNVGIIPLEQSDKVYKLNSAKFLQYLAANIPIVSVPFYEFLEFKENVHFCDSRIEFIKSIDYILNSKNQSDIKYENLENWDWNKISGSASIHINELINQ